MGKSRRAIPYEVQVRVYARDKWLCHWCHRPVLFPPAVRLLEGFVKGAGWKHPMAYYHANWSRASSPLLDHLGAVIDHVEAFSTGGADDESNFVTACNKCNTRKNARTVEEHVSRYPSAPVKGKYGEPEHWDGLTSLFLVLADQGATLEPSEVRWAEALRAHFESASDS